MIGGFDFLVVGAFKVTVTAFFAFLDFHQFNNVGDLRMGLFLLILQISNQLEIFRNNNIKNRTLVYLFSKYSHRNSKERTKF